ncbi:methyl-CpG-binding domain-containing protein 2-like [Rhododendron vialii]|uniref:methyl-CpG-binding domain-containing protein 2-like n=1 Tax=Rhododendron vialii TaxID=182163 RepID=UPI00265DD5E9|nr:methyl-CpG-binding domain-containing protein 2-like [Rhododendron vialii]XP_058207844.1 methyl-CpG-binding domain-containing protein 2-like [Rhododendron vialii]XP_058207845.1 methyl-CpG-binding domain-containing protein 2-like [Rhododendron vialii]
MQSSPMKLTLKVGRKDKGINGSTKKEENGFSGCGFPDRLGNSIWKPIDLTSSEEDSAVEDNAEEDSKSSEDSRNQLVIYDPAVNGAREIEAALDPNEYQPRNTFPFTSSCVLLPSVGAFTVQCATCFKWRLVPTKEKYEEIREHISEEPFSCETAREWRPEISCEDPTDICQDDGRLWAIDKPNIAQPPPGWERLLRIRGEGSTKFADVYYVVPSGKRLRSMVEIQRYLLQHPEYMEAGVTMSQFSFQTPKPLQENYVRKRAPARLTTPVDGGSNMVRMLPGFLQPSDVNPLAWAGPDGHTDVRLGPSVSTHLIEASPDEPMQHGQPKSQKRSFVPSEGIARCSKKVSL